MTDGYLIKDMLRSERPRERVVERGVASVRTAELIAVLLRTGTKGRSAVLIAEELLKEFGSLDSLAGASLEDLRKIKGIGLDKAIGLQCAFNLASRMAQEIKDEQPLLDTPERIADFLRDENRGYNVERFAAVLLNARRRLIRVERLSHGLVDTILVHPREVFHAAIAARASLVVLIHNHPSGDPTPSDADLRATRDLIRAGQLLKIELLDHVILGRRTPDNEGGFVSLRALGFFNT